MSKVYYKTAEEIEQVRKSADVLSQLLAEIAQRVEPGITTLSLDQFAYDFIKDHKGTPAFLNYHGFPYSLCISVNDQVVHGFPSDYVLQEGDIISRSEERRVGKEYRCRGWKNASEQEEVR